MGAVVPPALLVMVMVMVMVTEMVIEKVSRSCWSDYLIVQMLIMDMMI